MNEKMEYLVDLLEKLRSEISKVIIGQQEVLNQVLTVILTGNHGLIEGVPGIAKTLLVRTVAKVLTCEFSRIQFTPDLMPADITGTNVYNMKQSEFTFVKGPVFTMFLLADEINRAPAKTQSALLQAMQEREVSIDCQTFKLSPFFTVFATQNPIEYEGTYPLPEAQKDRFMLKISMDVPGAEDELLLASRTLTGNAPELTLKSEEVVPVISLEELETVKSYIEDIVMKEEIIKYIVQIIRETRRHESIMVGASPRATQSLVLASRAYAVINGRDFVTPDDVKSMAVPVLEHRLVQRPEYEIEGLTIKEIINDILTKVTVPR